MKRILYMPIGRPTNAMDSVSLMREWLYNNRSELAAASIGTNLYGYSYDTIGNRLWSAANLATNTYVANALNQYTSVGRGVLDPPQTAALIYDADGNMTRDGRFLYSYDAENRLRSITARSATSGSLRVLNAYDHRNRRIRKTLQQLHLSVAQPPALPVEIREWQTLETHTFVWDGNNIVLEKVDFADGTTRTFEYFWGMDKSGTEQDAGGVEGLLAVSMDGVFYIPCYDHNGNIVLYISETGGIAAQYTYDPYGNIIESSGPLANEFSFGFSTKYHDREIGTVTYQQRVYGPALGRWFNRDPIGESGGENLYGFVNNYPCLAIDSTGLYLELTISPTVREIRKGRMRQGYLTDDDLTAYDIAYAEFRPRFDAAVSNLKKCCSKKALSNNKACKLIMNPSLKVLVVFEINSHWIPEPEYGNGGVPFAVFNSRTAEDGKKASGIALKDMYNTRTQQPVPLFLYYDENGKTHRESLEALLFHEVTHYDQWLFKDDKRLVPFEDSQDSKDMRRFGSKTEKDAVENENTLRRCCPELNDNHERYYYRLPSQSKRRR